MSNPILACQNSGPMLLRVSIATREDPDVKQDRMHFQNSMMYETNLNQDNRCDEIRFKRFHKE